MDIFTAFKITLTLFHSLLLIPKGKFVATHFHITNVIGPVIVCSLLHFQVNILLKNVIDVGMGGAVFWAFGYGLVHGNHHYSTPYYGIGHYFFAPGLKDIESINLRTMFCNA